MSPLQAAIDLGSSKLLNLIIEASLVFFEYASTFTR